VEQRTEPGARLSRLSLAYREPAPPARTRAERRTEETGAVSRDGEGKETNIPAEPFFAQRSGLRGACDDDDTYIAFGHVRLSTTYNSSENIYW
jgi:hypothetical protein